MIVGSFWRHGFTVVACALGLTGTTIAYAEDLPPLPAARQVAQHDPAPAGPGDRVRPRPPAPSGHHDEAAHGGDHGASSGHDGSTTHSVPSINWVYGLLGERSDLEQPTIWYRPTGMPVPFLASLLNLAVLVGLGVIYGRKPLTAALQQRRETMMREIDEAARIKAKAKKRLRTYQKQLARIGEERTRVEETQRAQGEQEKVKILHEADEKCRRLRLDVGLLLEHERTSAHSHLLHRVVEAAAARAEALVQQQLSLVDQRRLVTQYLGELSQHSGTNGFGGNA